MGFEAVVHYYISYMTSQWGSAINILKQHTNMKSMVQWWPYMNFWRAIIEGG